MAGFIRRWLFMISLPILWGIICAINFRYPGDEYMLWGIGSMAGLWGHFVFPFLVFGSSAFAHSPPIFLAGVLTMGALGWVLDWLRASVFVFVPIWLVSALGLTIKGLAHFESYQHAMSKNGSLNAYILPSLNLCLLGTALLMIVIMMGWHGVRALRSTRPAVNPIS